MGQILRRFSIKRKDGKQKGTIVLIKKSSIGTIHINGKAYSYNLDKVATHKIDFDGIQHERKKRQQKTKKIIYIRRK